MYFICNRCDIFDHFTCEKIGDIFSRGGYCSDAFAEESPKRIKHGRKTGRAYRQKMRRKNIQDCRDRDEWTGWPYGTHINGHWNGGKYILGSYIKRPKSSANKVFFKRVSNKKVRRSKEISSKGNGYRKLFDYWGTIC